MLADEPNAVAQCEPLARPLCHCRVERSLSDEDIAGGSNRPANLPRVSVPKLHRGARLGVLPIDCRTKAEHRATILLPNWVARHDTKADETDAPAEILRENKTAQNRLSPAETAATELQNRCSTAELTRQNQGITTKP
jgi:hypothetical protein